ncbi:MAG: hypothetical protein GY752_09745, partial [bacterium]|nr:hypothetical protein [bacterium]
RSHTFDADDLAIGFTTGQLEFTLADGASTATSTSTSTSLSNSVVAGVNSGTVEVTSAGIDLSFAGTSDLKLDSSAGAAGQLLTSGGAGAAPTWTTVSVTDTNFANTDLTATGNRSHTFDANNLEIGFTTGNLDFTLSSGGQSSQIAAEAAGLDFSSASGADSTNLNVTSNQIDLSFGGAADFKVDGSAGLAGQLLTSSGPGSAPTWTTVSVTDTNFANTDLTSTGNRTHTFDADDLDIDFTTGVLQFSFSSGTASGLISGTSAGVVLTGADGGNSASLIASSSDLNLTFSGTSDLKINSSAGTVGQLLTSSGPGVAPTWTTVAVTDTNFANTDLTSTGNRAHTFDADNLALEFTSGQLAFEFVNGTDAANIGAEADEFQVAIASGTSTAELSVDPNGSTFSNADPSGGAEIELSPTGMDLSF